MNENHPIITLTTDFGAGSHYIAQMKGAILSINSTAKIVDISHNIQAQNIFQGALVLRDSIGTFPERTIHVVVIDPGVGTDREIFYVSTGDINFVAPNNGVLSLALETKQTSDIRRIKNPEFWRKDVSSTFHGRDIMAPVAAHLSVDFGIAHELGEQVYESELAKLNSPKPSFANGKISGQVVFADSFGNLMTNISKQFLQESNVDVARDRIQCQIGDHVISGICENYQSVETGSAILLFGSSKHLEIAVANGNAESALGISIGEQVTLQIA